MEKPNFKINQAYENIHTQPDFEEINGKNLEEKPDFTPLDSFAIPAELIENKEKFLQWFEPRFFNLQDENGKISQEGLEEFSQNLKDAVDFLKSNPYILSPRIDKGFSLSKSAENKVSNGFNNIEDIMAFFKKVALENIPENTKYFFSPDRKSASGAERLTHCRILSVAYVSERIKKSHAFKTFLDHSRFILGRNPEKDSESGILSNLNIPTTLDILRDNETDTFKIFEWVERNQSVKGCSFNNIGQSGSSSYFIPELQIGIKEGLRTFLKYLRDPKEAFKIADDFLRFRFIFNNDMETEKILDLMYDLQEEAKKKKDPVVQIEFREKNYLSEKELSEYFPKGEEKIKRGILDNIKIDENPASGKGYKNMSAKIKLYHPSRRKYYFAFEIIFLRKKEHKENERLERAANHFLMEMHQSTELASRMTGKMTHEEIILALKQYLEKNITTEEIPKVLIGDAYNPKEYGSSNIEMDFAGSMDEKARILFDFLVSDGTLKHVSADFPTIKKPATNKRVYSGYYIVGENGNRILKNLGAEK